MTCIVITRAGVEERVHRVLPVLPTRNLRNPRHHRPSRTSLRQPSIGIIHRVRAPPCAILPHSPPEIGHHDAARHGSYLAAAAPSASGGLACRLLSSSVTSGAAAGAGYFNLPPTVDSSSSTYALKPIPSPVAALVISEIDSSAATSLQAVKLLALYLTGDKLLQQPVASALLCVQNASRLYPQLATEPSKVSTLQKHASPSCAHTRAGAGVVLAEQDWMRSSVAFWHTFRGTSADPFGAPTMTWPWEDGTNSLAMTKRRMRAHFELMEKLGVDKWCFHDRDIAPDGKTLEETNSNLDEIVQLAKQLQGETNIKPLWGTMQLFMHPRYMHGAATSLEVKVYAYAAAQVKKALEVTHYLGGENYVFWGGREGYQTLLNTDMKRELDHLANFLQAAVDYKKKIRFNGFRNIYPCFSGRYDWDVATTFAFLQKYGLTGEFKINVECNHATLSRHSCHHELETARINGLLGNIDANTGDPQVGWDTDQFMTDIAEATLVMSSVVKNVVTLLYGFKQARKGDFETLEKKVLEWGEPTVASDKQELAEIMFQSAL
ncbi:Xylose isomerase [Zea mays]|uniref:Xylose isomerase n=1 Tax=Zea mays TaxID=4577 RepID=A0A3L6DG00_MAIZE|nr:Xylose isomerase [Zea mays]